MSQIGYLILAISVIILLLAVFIVSFILCKRVPVPKGMEEQKRNAEKCASCSNLMCHYHEDESEEKKQ